MTQEKTSEGMQSKKPKVSKMAKSKEDAAKDIRDMLVDGEQIVEQGVIHAGIYWKSIAVLIIAFVATLFVAPIGLLLALTGVIMIIHATIKKEILMFVLTDRRVFVRYGILQVDVVDIRFNKIESVELERMLPGYIMGYANLVVMGTGNRYIMIPYVANGLEIRRSYNRLTLEDDSEGE